MRQAVPGQGNCPESGVQRTECQGRHGSSSPTSLRALTVLEKFSDTSSWPSQDPLLTLNLKMASTVSHPAAPLKMCYVLHCLLHPKQDFIRTSWHLIPPPTPVYSSFIWKQGTRGSCGIEEEYWIHNQRTCLPSLVLCDHENVFCISEPQSPYLQHGDNLPWGGTGELEDSNQRYPLKMSRHAHWITFFHPPNTYLWNSCKVIGTVLISK